MTRSNMLNIAINHRLISWSATFCCCQMYWHFLLLLEIELVLVGANCYPIINNYNKSALDKWTVTALYWLLFLHLSFCLPLPNFVLLMQHLFEFREQTMLLLLQFRKSLLQLQQLIQHKYFKSHYHNNHYHHSCKSYLVEVKYLQHWMLFSQTNPMLKTAVTNRLLFRIPLKIFLSYQCILTTVPSISNVSSIFNQCQ